VKAFVARDVLHDEIHTQLNSHDADASTRTLAVWGLGGAGKTQLVLDYVRRHRAEYKATFWIGAGQKESLERDIVNLYQTLFGLTAAAGAETVGVEDALTGVKSWFSGRQGPWLMVFDSADAIEDSTTSGYIDIRHYIPDVGSLHVIVTSRSSAAGDMTQLEGVRVGEMKEAQAAELFYRYSQLPRDEAGTRDEIAVIVRELGCLALAVTLAAAYVGTTPRLQSNVRAYLPEYRQRRRELLERKPEMLVHQYNESVLTTWETSYQAVAGQCPEASVLMTMLSCLSFDDIFLGLFGIDDQVKDSRRAEDEVDGDGASWRRLLSPGPRLDRYRIEEGFRVLQKYSLVQWKADQQSYTMHKLVHAWGFDRLTGEEQRKISRAAFGLIVEVVDAINASAAPEDKLRVVPHVVASFAALGGESGGWKEVTEGLLDNLEEVGLFLEDVGKWSEELAVQKVVLDERRRILGEEHPDTIMAMNNLANTLGDQGQLEEAAEMFKKVVEKMRWILGEEHPYTITAMNNLACIFGDQGQLDEAAKMMEEVLKKRRRILGEEHPDTIKAMSNLTGTLRDQGQLDKAAKMMEEVLVKMRRILGKEHLDTIKAMNNLALTLRDQCQLDEAAKVLKEVLDKRRRILGEEHLSTLTAMSNLALILGDQGQLDEAANMMKEVLKKMQQTLGEEHPETIMVMSNLAATLGDQGQLDETTKMMKEVLKKRRQILGEEHPDTIMAMNNLANTLGDQGQLDEAAKMLKEVLEKSRRILGEEHPDTMLAISNLAVTLRDQGQLEEAAKLMKEVLEKRRQILGDEHSDTKRAARNLNVVVQRQSVQQGSIRTPSRRRARLLKFLGIRSRK
jgi:tetratricopeptide (TPR) repeat protein